MDTPCLITRRAALKAAAAPACAFEAAPDPILAPYRLWCEARNEWLAAPEEGPESEEASDRETAALRAMLDTAPAAPAGVAALAHLLWSLVGPSAIPGTEEFEESCDEASNRAIAALWRFGSGREGLPPNGDAQFDAAILEA